MDALNQAFALAGIAAPDAAFVIAQADPAENVGVQHLAQADPAAMEDDVNHLAQADPAAMGDDDNKNPWVLVACKNTGRIARQGARAEELVPSPPERLLTLEVPWVQNGRSIRAMRKKSMARRSGMVSTPEGDAILIYGSFGPYGLEC